MFRPPTAIGPAVLTTLRRQDFGRQLVAAHQPATNIAALSGLPTSRMRHASDTSPGLTLPVGVWVCRMIAYRRWPAKAEFWCDVISGRTRTDHAAMQAISARKESDLEYRIR